MEKSCFSDRILVSVIVFAFNHEKYIFKTLDGIVKQKTNFDFEVIVHDDCSTDSTKSVISAFQKKYPELIKPIYQNENQYSKGISNMFVHCFPKAKGKYIAFCEGDDFWIDSQKLQKEVDVLENDKTISLVCHASYLVDKNNFIIGKMKPYDDSCFISTENIITKDRNSFAFASLMFRNSVFANYPSEFIGSPVGDVMYKIFGSFQGKVFYLNDLMSAYRVFTPGSWTSRNNTLKARQSFNSKMKGYYHMLNRYSNFEYDELFKQVLLENDFNVLRYGKSCKPLKDIRYSQFYSNLSLKSKILLRFQIRHKFLFKVYSRCRRFGKKLFYKYKKL